MSEELKSCPFCGGNSIGDFHHIVSGIPDSWHVECLADDCGCGTCHHETRAEAITAWNTRPTDAQARPVDSDGVVEALREARESLQTGKDYAQDAASGGLVYTDGKRVSPTMATGDVERITGLIARIDAILATLPAQSDAVAAERERCAQIAETAVPYVVGEKRDLCDAIAAAIRGSAT